MRGGVGRVADVSRLCAAMIEPSTRSKWIAPKTWIDGTCERAWVSPLTIASFAEVKLWILDSNGFDGSAS